MMMEALHYSETSVIIRVTLHNIPEDSILHIHRYENLKPHMYCIVMFMFSVWVGQDST
jgi:hypothetical protein